MAVILSMDNGLNIFQFSEYKPEPRFTPVRRRGQGRPAESPANAIQAPWTTTRCNRLLRPISSRITLLRKQRESRAHRRQIVSQSLRNNSCGPISSQNTVCTTSALFRQTEKKYEDDPEWAPDRASKRLKRTYSSKSGAKHAKNRDVYLGQENHRQAGGLKIQLPMVNVHTQPVLSTCVMEYANECQVVSGPTNLPISHDELSKEVSGLQSRNDQSSSRESFRRLAKSISPSEWMLIDGLYNGLDALLKATATRKPPKDAGTRSLFNTCLRKVPHYIADEEHLATKEDPDLSAEVSSTIYNDLESLGSSQAGGWKPLREVVRAHGIAIIGSAIEDGVITASIARGLIILCLQASAVNDAISLCDHLLRTVHHLAEPKTLSDRLFGPETSIALQTLNDLSTQSEMWCHHYRSLNTMLQEDLIPVEWISSHGMIDCWNRVMKSVTQQDEYAVEAGALLRTAVSLSYHGPNVRAKLDAPAPHASSRASSEDSSLCQLRGTGKSKYNFNNGLDFIRTNEGTNSTALTSTVSNLITVLLSVEMVRLEPVDSMSSPSSPSVGVIRTLAFEAYQYCKTMDFSVVPSEMLAVQAARICIPLLANYLMTASCTTMDTAELCVEWLDVISSLDVRQKVIDVLASFLSAAGQCCEQAGSKTAFEYIQIMVQRLLETSDSSLLSINTRQFMAQVALAAAFDFSEQTNQRAHLDWALEMEEATEGLLATSKTNTTTGEFPRKQPSKPAAGFRWEEGICEWIAKSPETEIKPQKLDIKFLPNRSNSCSTCSKEPTSPLRKRSCSVLSEARPYAQYTKAVTKPRGRPRGRPRCLPVCNVQVVISRCSYENQEPFRTRKNVLEDDADELCTSAGGQNPRQEARMVFKEIVNSSKQNGYNHAKIWGRSGSSRQWSKPARINWKDSSMERIVSDDELGI